MKEALRDTLERTMRVLLDAAGDSGPLPEFSLEVPKNPDHGDFACNAALVITKRLGQAPREIAECLVAALVEQKDVVEAAEIAGPGFVNIRLRGARWHDRLREVLEAGPRYGHSDRYAGQKIQV